MAITQQVPRGPVEAQLQFYKPPADGSEPFNYVEEPPEGQPQNNFGVERQAVTIEDVRGRESEFTLDRDAFQIIQGVPPSAETEFVDDASITAKYYPEVERLLLAHVPGANRVVFFDHTIRRAGKADAPRAPVERVHIDQTAASAEMRVRRHLGDDAERLLRGRYRIINVWRPLNKTPIESYPLAYASSATVRDDDVVPVKHIYRNGYVGQTAGIRYHPDQRFYYLSGMTGDERILLECFDSEALKEGSGVAGGRVPHTAFADPRTRPDAEGRESIEVRALVFGP